MAVATQPCGECGKQTGPVPEDLRGIYRLPEDAEQDTLIVYSGDHFCRSCAKRLINDITTFGSKQPTLGEFGGFGASDSKSEADK